MRRPRAEPSTLDTAHNPTQHTNSPERATRTNRNHAEQGVNQRRCLVGQFEHQKSIGRVERNLHLNFMRVINIHYLTQNICRLFQILSQFSFTANANETELDYYHQKGTAQVASRVVKRLKSLKCLELKASAQKAT